MDFLLSSDLEIWAYNLLGYGRASTVELIVELFEMSELNCRTKTRAYMEARNVLEVHMCMEWRRRF